MEFKQTRHQVARGSRPDGETSEKMLLIKSASALHATYQIRLLTYLATKKGKKLIIEVRKGCKVHASLDELVRQHPKTLKIVRG